MRWDSRGSDRIAVFPRNGDARELRLSGWDRGSSWCGQRTFLSAPASPQIENLQRKCWIIGTWNRVGAKVYRWLRSNPGVIQVFLCFWWLGGRQEETEAMQEIQCERI